MNTILISITTGLVVWRLTVWYYDTYWIDDEFDVEFEDADDDEDDWG